MAIPIVMGFRLPFSKKEEELKGEKKSEIISDIRKNAFEKELDKKKQIQKQLSKPPLLGNFEKDVEDASKKRLNDEEKKIMMQKFEMYQKKIQEEKRLEFERDKLKKEFIEKQKQRIEEMKRMKSETSKVKEKSVQKSIEVPKSSVSRFEKKPIFVPKQNGGLFGLFKPKPKIQLPMERKTLPMVIPNLPKINIPPQKESLLLKRTADKEIGELDEMLNRLHKLDSDINKLLGESDKVERDVISNLSSRMKSRKKIKLSKKKTRVKTRVSRKVNKRVSVNVRRKTNKISKRLNKTKVSKVSLKRRNKRRLKEKIKRDKQIIIKIHFNFYMVLCVFQKDIRHLIS